VTARSLTAADHAADRAVIDRLHRLRVVLPALAEDAATARREAARLSRENASMLRRIAELQAGRANRTLDEERSDHANERLVPDVTPGCRSGSLNLLRYPVSGAESDEDTRYESHLTVEPTVTG
jgi:hypothetical protein